jgi:DNA-binding MarR family transcriptional regulator
LRAQIDSKSGVLALFDRLVADALPSESGVEAWRSFMQAHATLMRRLASDLVERTGLTLGDFDVLCQLAIEGGELRMTDLATRAFSSRSGMTRRIDRLADQRLVTRTSSDADGRGVVVALTEAGVSRLAETAPVHFRAVAELFVARLSERELVALKKALDKVSVDCEFG